MNEQIKALVQSYKTAHKQADTEALSHILEGLAGMNKRDLEVLVEVMDARGKLSDSEFRYLGRHARDNALGKAVRVPSTEFPWVKNAMIHLARATQSVNAYMYHFGHLPPSKQEKLMEITASFNTIVDASKKITKLSTHKRPNNSKHTSKPKTLKAAKAAALSTEKLPEENPSTEVESVKASEA